MTLLAIALVCATVVVVAYLHHRTELARISTVKAEEAEAIALKTLARMQSEHAAMKAEHAGILAAQNSQAHTLSTITTAMGLAGISRGR